MILFTDCAYSLPLFSLWTKQDSFRIRQPILILKTTSENLKLCVTRPSQNAYLPMRRKALRRKALRLYCSCCRSQALILWFSEEKQYLYHRMSLNGNIFVNERKAPLGDNGARQTGQATGMRVQWRGMANQAGKVRNCP